MDDKEEREIEDGEIPGEVNLSAAPAAPASSDDAEARRAPAEAAPSNAVRASDSLRPCCVFLPESACMCCATCRRPCDCQHVGPISRGQRHGHGSANPLVRGCAGGCHGIYAKAQVGVPGSRRRGIHQQGEAPGNTPAKAACTARRSTQRLRRASSLQGSGGRSRASLAMARALRRMGSWQWRGRQW